MNFPKGPLPTLCQNWNWPILLVWGPKVLDYFDATRQGRLASKNLLLRKGGEENVVNLHRLMTPGPWLFTYMNVRDSHVGAVANAQFGGMPVMVVDMSRIYLEDLNLLFHKRNAPTIGWNLPFWSYKLVNVTVSSDFATQLIPILGPPPFVMGLSVIERALKETQVSWENMCGGCFGPAAAANSRKNRECAHLLCEHCHTCYHFSHQRVWGDVQANKEENDEDFEYWNDYDGDILFLNEEMEF